MPSPQKSTRYIEIIDGEILIGKILQSLHDATFNTPHKYLQLLVWQLIDQVGLLYQILFTFIRFSNTHKLSLTDYNALDDIVSMALIKWYTRPFFPLSTYSEIFLLWIYKIYESIRSLCQILSTSAVMAHSSNRSFITNQRNRWAKYKLSESTLNTQRALIY